MTWRCSRCLEHSGAVSLPIDHTGVVTLEGWNFSLDIERNFGSLSTMSSLNVVASLSEINISVRARVSETSSWSSLSTSLASKHNFASPARVSSSSRSEFTSGEGGVASEVASVSAISAVFKVATSSVLSLNTVRVSVGLDVIDLMIELILGAVVMKRIQFSMSSSSLDTVLVLIHSWAGHVKSGSAWHGWIFRHWNTTTDVNIIVERTVKELVIVRDATGMTGRKSTSGTSGSAGERRLDVISCLIEFSLSLDSLRTSRQSSDT